MVSGSVGMCLLSIEHGIWLNLAASCICNVDASLSDIMLFNMMLLSCLQEAQKLAKGHSKCEAHIAKHGSSWDPIKFVSLCSEVADKKDPDLLRFCEGVMAAEFQMLLDYCYAKL